MTEHRADPESWDCVSCSRPYPCASARRQMASEMDEIDLATHGWSLLDEAVRVMPNAEPRVLFHRFVSWTRVRE